ncbi:hypothetical protein LINPERHAP2_LOCUS19844 [Linum perenne]
MLLKRLETIKPLLGLAEYFTW